MVVKPPVGAGWRLCLVVAGPAVVAWLAAVGGWMAAVLGPSLTPGGGRILGLSCLLLGALVVPHVVVPQKCRMQFPRVYFKV